MMQFMASRGALSDLGNQNYDRVKAWLAANPEKASAGNMNDRKGGT
jgi:hypothetical protein